MGKCIVCGELTEADYNDYCPSHTAAFRQVRNAYELWSNAYGTIRFEQFLEKLSKLPETGIRAKEVADFLAKNLGKWVD